MKNSNFVHNKSHVNSNGPLRGLSDVNYELTDEEMGMWDELGAGAVIAIGIGGFVLSSVVQTWVGAKLLGYDD